MQKNALSRFSPHRKKSFIKSFLIMKLSAILLIACCLQANAKVFSQKITLSVKNSTAEYVFHEIEKQTGYGFIYAKEQLAKMKPVDLNVVSTDLITVLNMLFKEQVFTYTISGNNISIKEKPVNKQEENLLEAPPPFPVTGKVVDAEGRPLEGVSVVLKSSDKGVTSDKEGKFSIEVPQGGDVLIFSYVGFENTELSVTRSASLNITLMRKESAAEEVVVTAFGIKRSNKALTYATQQVDGKAVSAAGNPNLLNGLQGKVAGVTVALNSGMPGKSPDIRIRGSRSISGNNAPLYVIDGMAVSGGDRAVDFNPNDVASINILKGPAASALYGLRASNGVVIITTKSGAGIRTPSISFESQYSIDKVSFLPDLQMEYAQGENGVFNPNSIFTWGPKISTLGTYTNQLGEQEQAAVYDNDKDFYKTGGTLNNNISFSDGGDKGNYLIAIGNAYQTGIVAGSDLNRTNLNFKGNFTPYNKFTTSISFNYSDTKVNDYPEQVGNVNYARGAAETPPSYNLKGKPIAYPDDPYRQIFYRASQNNPYWYIAHNYRDAQTKRTFGNIFLKYDLSNDISLNYRIGIDRYALYRISYEELGTATVGRTNPPSGGSVNFLNQYSNQLNSNFFLSYKKQLSENLDIDFIAGNEIYDNRVQTTSTTGSNFIQSNWPNLGNATSLTGSNSESKQRIVGFYGNINLGWKDIVYLTSSVRNDVVSNMPPGRRSFLYPSVGASVILTEAMPSLQSIFSFAKARISYAEVGQAGPLYVGDQGFNTYNPRTGQGSFIFPFNGLASLAQNTTRINPDLTPENTRSYEFGVDLRFFNDRLGIDYTYFTSLSSGQIFNVPVPVTTGATNEIRNAGVMSSNGHEIALTLLPIRTKNFSWRLLTNFTLYENKVKELFGDTKRVVISSAEVATLVAEVGNVYPIFLGTTYLKDPKTNKIIVQSNPNSPSYGLPLINTIPSVIKSPNPDYQFSFINALKFKEFNLSFQLDWRQGGVQFSQTKLETTRRGLYGETRDRETQIVLDAVKGTYVNGSLQLGGDNDITITKDRNYFDILRQILEPNLTNASFVRLRELSLSYDFPVSILKNKMIKSASVFLTGRNLFLITDAFTDPEVNLTESYGSNQNSAGIEWSQTPQTKSFGGGIRLSF